MHQLFRAKEFLKYRFLSGNEHDIHSPLVYDLFTNVITSRNPFYAFEKIEAVRSKMILSNEKIPVLDFGTGGEEKNQRMLSLSFIARNYVKSQKYGQLLFRLVNYFHPSTILEIGTSLGVSSLYLSSCDSKSQVVTIEGCPNIAGIANKNFENAKANNITQIIGEFSKSLPQALSYFTKLDFAYFDGNHRKQPTLDYFNQCLKLQHSDSVFVFDDIYWSSEMAEAWKEIKKHPSVTLTIDLYSIGIIFFKEAQQKQHFRLQY